MIEQFIFIPGVGRCGTTWVTKWLSEHPLVETIHESYLVPQTFRLIKPIEYPFPKEGVVELSEIRDLLHKIYNRRAGKKTIFIDKSPTNLYDSNGDEETSKIWSLFPSAKIMIFYKDGKDIAYSQKNLPWQSRKLWTASEIISLWKDFVKFYSLNPPSEKLIYVKYENLLDNPEQESDRICKFIGITHYSIRPWEKPTNTKTTKYDKQRWKLLPEGLINKLKKINNDLNLMGYDPFE